MPRQDFEKVAGAFAAIADLPETTPDEVHAEQAAYIALHRGAEWERAKTACDLWTAAFFAPLTKDSAARCRPRGTCGTRLADACRKAGSPGSRTNSPRRSPSSIGRWNFPRCSRAAGFDVMLGNPPWEVSEFSDKEFFKIHLPSLAKLRGAKRKAAIDELEASDNYLSKKYRLARQALQKLNEFGRSSGRYRLSAHGKLNTYALFAETFLSLIDVSGRSGLIVPTSIAVDDTNKYLFNNLISSGRLASLYDFENREGIFPEVDSRAKFSLVTIGSTVGPPALAFFLTCPEHLADERRTFLSEREIALFNPNTRTSPIFRSRADAELTGKIYGSVPVLINDGHENEGNPWKLTLRQGLFNMTSDSLFLEPKPNWLSRG